MCWLDHSWEDQLISFRFDPGADHVLALRQNGTVLSWGFGEQGQLGRLGRRVSDPKRMLLPALVPLKNVAGLVSSTQASHRAVGSAVCTCGVDRSAPVGLRQCLFVLSMCAAGFGSRRVFRAVAIAAASYGSFAVAANGVLAAFGVNVSGQLGLPVQVHSAALSHTHRC